jgi:hypothetical protein
MHEIGGFYNDFSSENAAGDLARMFAELRDDRTRDQVSDAPPSPKRDAHDGVSHTQQRKLTTKMNDTTRYRLVPPLHVLARYKVFQVRGNEVHVVKSAFDLKRQEIEETLAAAENEAMLRVAAEFRLKKEIALQNNSEEEDNALRILQQRQNENASEALQQPVCAVEDLTQPSENLAAGWQLCKACTRICEVGAVACEGTECCARLRAAQAREATEEWEAADVPHSMRLFEALDYCRECQIEKGFCERSHGCGFCAQDIRMCDTELLQHLEACEEKHSNICGVRLRNDFDGYARCGLDEACCGRKCVVELQQCQQEFCSTNVCPMCLVGCEV